jgi:hypothetical protein
MKALVNESNILARLLEQVKRRALLQLTLEQGSVAFASCFAGVIVLLIIGTQLLDWYWPVLLLTGTFIIGMWRMRGRVPTKYQIAQQVDQRLGLKDSISTAVFFSDAERQQHVESALVEAQRRNAESMAVSADVAVAAPLKMPRQAWACLALFGLSAALLVVRYGFNGSLDLTQPMVRIPFDVFSGTPPVVARTKAFPKQKLPENFDGVTVPTDGREQEEGERKKTPEEINIQGESVEADSAEGKEAMMAKEGKGQEGGKEGGEAEEKGEGSAAGDDRSQQESGSNSPGQQNAKAPNQKGNKNSTQQPSDNNSSLMDKMKDAMANMLARMKMSPKPGEGSKNASASQQGASQSASGQKQAGQKGSPAPGKQGEGQSKSDEAGEQEGEGASKSMDAQGKMSDAGGQKQQAQEGKSGAGKQDGDKDIKNAEQQAAMGKISELLGKRAQNMTGEIMVEVSSGRQSLKTQYTQKNAAHADTGGEISRDEVPATYQDFVRQYFEEVRKPSAAKPVAAPAAPPQSK